MSSGKEYTEQKFVWSKVQAGTILGIDAKSERLDFDTSERFVVQAISKNELHLQGLNTPLNNTVKDDLELLDSLIIFTPIENKKETKVMTTPKTTPKVEEVTPPKVEEVTTPTIAPTVDNEENKISEEPYTKDELDILAKYTAMVSSGRVAAPTQRRAPTNGGNNENFISSNSTGSRLPSGYNEDKSPYQVKVMVDGNLWGIFGGNTKAKATKLARRVIRAKFNYVWTVKDMLKTNETVKGITWTK